jgi:hypothetical protein
MDGRKGDSGRKGDIYFNPKEFATALGAGSTKPLERFLRGAGNEDFHQLPFVLGGTAIVVHGIDFRGGDFAHFTQRGIVDPLAVQYALRLLGSHNGRGDRIQTQANVLANTVFRAERNRNANGSEIFDASRRKFDMRPSGPAGGRDADFRQEFAGIQGGLIVIDKKLF